MTERLTDSVSVSSGVEQKTAVTPKGAYDAIAQSEEAIKKLIVEELEKYLPLTGGTLTGRITSSVEDFIQGSGPNGVFTASAENTTTGDKLYFGIGAGGKRRGIWDASANAWLVYFEEDENVLRTKDGTVITSAGGTLTGDLRSAATDAGRFCKTHATGSIVISGGTDVDDGASIHAFGKDSSNEHAGKLFLSSVATGGTRHYLVYNPDGSLQDDWNSVLSYMKTFRFLESADKTITLPSGGTWDVYIYEQGADGNYGGANIYYDQAGGSTITSYHQYVRAIAIKKAW